VLKCRKIELGKLLVEKTRQLRELCLKEGVRDAHSAPDDTRNDVHI